MKTPSLKPTAKRSSENSKADLIKRLIELQSHAQTQIQQSRHKISDQLENLKELNVPEDIKGTMLSMLKAKGPVTIKVLQQVFPLRQFQKVSKELLASGEIVLVQGNRGRSYACAEPAGETNHKGADVELEASSPEKPVN